MSASASEAGATSAHRDGPYSGLPNKLVSAANGISYAYRDTCSETSTGVPLVLLNHFRGNLDNWDPALVDGPHSLGLAEGAGEAAIWTTLASAWIHQQTTRP